MPDHDPLRPYASRLGRLLADQRGREILAELQKLRVRAAAAADQAMDNGRAADEQAAAGHAAETQAAENGQAGGGHVGVWQAEPGDGGIALRRRGDVPASVLADWADVSHVPAPGAARRVVLVGESAARGWPLDPAFNPAVALSRQLDAASPGGYQCVDLAKTGATATDLITLARQLPLARPDVVVAFAGNNWSLPPEEIESSTSSAGEIEIRDLLAAALRDGGYAGMRQAFLATLVLGRARRFCAQLAALHKREGTRIVVVIPEFNLRGWRPPPDAEVPVLPAPALGQWHELRELLAGACARADRAAAERLAAAMRALDGGTSPVPGQLLGRLAESLADGTAARSELEDSRDAACGLFIRHTPRIVRGVQHLLHSFAAEHRFPCVDLRAVLAAPDLPGLPDEKYFHDYCHLSDLGIEAAMAAVADAVAGEVPGGTLPGPGAGPRLRAFAHAHAAAHLAYQGQPVPVVLGRLRAALGADPGLRPLMDGVLELLSCPRPAWIQPSAAQLAATSEVSAFVLPLAAARGLSTELWTLRECLAELTGAGTPAGPARTDLLVPPDARGHAAASWAPGSSYHRATAQRSVLAFALDRPRPAAVDLTYRMPAAPPAGSATVCCNGRQVGEVPARRRWSTSQLSLPAGAVRGGVNWLSFRWPVPEPDAAACQEADAAALSCGDFPAVLPVFGEIFHAVLTARQ